VLVGTAEEWDVWEGGMVGFETAELFIVHSTSSRETNAELVNKINFTRFICLLLIAGLSANYLIRYLILLGA
jgi:hypothetical protein